MGEVVIHQPSYLHQSVTIGKGTKIGSFSDIGKNVVIGKNCNIQSSVTISNGCKIGRNVFIGPNSSLLNDKFPIGKIQPCIIEDDVVIGGGVTLLPNVRIGRKSVIGAGSVVTRNVPSGEVWKGNPAKFHMTRREYENKKKGSLRDSIFP